MDGDQQDQEDKSDLSAMLKLAHDSKRIPIDRTRTSRAAKRRIALVLISELVPITIIILAGVYFGLAFLMFLIALLALASNLVYLLIMKMFMEHRFMDQLRLKIRRSGISKKTRKHLR